MVKNHRQARQGALANSYKGPNHDQGLDWNSVRTAYYARMRDQVERGVQDAETQIWRENQLHLLADSQVAKFLERRALSKQPSKILRGIPLSPEARAKGGRKRGSGLDVDRMVELYAEGVKPDAIALQMGHAPATVRGHLKARGVWDGGKHKRGQFTGTSGSGPEQKTVCSRGHDLTAEGSTKQLFKQTRNGPVKNGRACVRCWGGPVT